MGVTNYAQVYAHKSCFRHNSITIYSTQELHINKCGLVESTLFYLMQ